MHHRVPRPKNADFGGLSWYTPCCIWYVQYTYLYVHTIMGYLSISSMYIISYVYILQYFTNPTWILLVTLLINFIYSGDTCSHLYIDLIANFNYLVNLKGNSLCKLSVAVLFTKSITKQFTQTVARWSSLSFSYLSWRDSDPKMPHFSRFQTPQFTDDGKKGKRIHVLWFPKALSYLLGKVSIWRRDMKFPHIPWTAVFQLNVASKSLASSKNTPASMSIWNVLVPTN